MTQEEKLVTCDESEHGENASARENAERPETDPPASQDGQATDEEKKAGDEAIEQVTLYKRKKRTGKYISKLDTEELDRLQRRKSLYMYLSTLLFAVSLFLKVEGRTRLSENRSLFAVFSLYVFAEVALIVFTVFVAVCGRGSQKIGRELQAKHVPKDGLDAHTFVSYEIFNVLHIALACGEIAVSVYRFGIWGACNIAVSAASAVLCFLSRQILYKANAGNLEYLP